MLWVQQAHNLDAVQARGKAGHAAPSALGPGLSTTHSCAEDRSVGGREKRNGKLAGGRAIVALAVLVDG